MYQYKAVVLKVVDGDTLHLNVDLGLDVWIKIKVRMAGINAPEMSTDEGKKSKAFLETKLPVGTNLVISTVKDRKEKYGRYLAYIFLDDSTKDNLKSINNLLVESGFAKVYE